MSPIGTIIAGKYEVKRLLGQGGMGAVYEGVHTEIGKRVAIKVIDPRHAGSEEVAARFRREARAASAVESDGIVQVFDVGHDPAVGLYMVMEFLTGEDLAMRLEREHKLDPSLVIAMGLQAARALGKAHGAGVVHRDLKPANLFLCATEEGSLKLKILDFGISKLARPDSASGETPAPTKGLTRSGVVIGTPQYMSPEQAQGLPVDARTDVWSLGAVLYEALSGRPVFEEGASYEQTIIRIVTGTPKPLSEVAPHVPASLATLVHWSLTHDADKRLPDCATFAQRLTEVQRDLMSHVVVPASDRISRVDALASTLSTSDPPIALPMPAKAGPADGTSATRRGQQQTAAGVTMPASAPRSRAPLAIAAVIMACALALLAVAAIRNMATNKGDQGTAVGLVSTVAPPVVTSAVTPPASALPTIVAVPAVPAVPAIPPTPSAGTSGSTTKPIASSHPTTKPSATTPTGGQYGGLGGVTNTY